jgi:AcrR family transcriptional regulator
MAIIDNEVKRRRPRGEARRLLLHTARRLFTEQGFAGTTTRQISDEAGVSEPLLFRYFGNKAGLFDAAMLEPYQAFMTDFMDRWHEELQHPELTEEMTRRFVAGLLDLMTKERKLFLALIAARAFESDGLSDGFNESDMSRELDRFDKLLRETNPSVPPKYLDSEVSFRLIVGVVMAVAVLDDWLFPSGSRHPSRQRIVKELTQFTLYGVFGKRPKLG